LQLPVGTGDCSLRSEQEKTRLFGGGFFVIRFIIFYKKRSPPKFAGIIITTTIIIAANRLMTLLMRFNMSECSVTNIRPPVEKTKNFVLRHKIQGSRFKQDSRIKAQERSKVQE